MEEIHSRNIEWNEFNGKSLLITGAYGMLASYLVFFLIYLREYHKIELSIIAQGRDERKASARFGKYLEKDYFTFLNKDIFSESNSSLEVDYVVHAAGISNPRIYPINPVEVLYPNAIGTYNLLKKCNPQKLKTFLYFSSGDIYGKVEDEQNITENTIGCVDPLDIHSCYGESKRMGETICYSYYKEYGFNTVIARIGHTYGPTMDIENDPRVFSSFIKNAVDNKDIVLHSDGSAKRPFCYISDAVTAYILLLLKGKGGEAYNVTNTEQFLSIRNLADIISKLPEKNLNVVIQKRKENDSYIKNTLNLMNKPIEEKLKALGWSHSVDVKEGFSRVYNYFKNSL